MNKTFVKAKIRQTQKILKETKIKLQTMHIKIGHKL